MAFLRDYVCPAGHVTEHLHGGTQSTAPVVIQCPECGAEAVARIEAKATSPLSPEQRLIEARNRRVPTVASL